MTSRGEIIIALFSVGGFSGLWGGPEVNGMPIYLMTLDLLSEKGLTGEEEWGGQ